MIKGKFVSSILLMLSLAVIPACKFFNKSEDSCSSCSTCPAGSDDSTALITVDGKPSLTVKEFENFLNKAVEGNEQMKIYMQFVPDFKEQLFNAKKRSVVLAEWAKRNKVRDSQQYREQEKMILDAIRENLDIQEFLKQNDPQISDEEAQKYYDENKTQDPRVVVSLAGIKASGVSFVNGNSANEFAENIKKNAAKDIDKVAKDKKLTVTQFGVVNSESNIDSKVKEKVATVKTFPTVLVVKGDNGKTWVVVAKSKQDAEFRPFEQVKELIKRVLKPKKMEELLEKEQAKLEKDFNVVYNKTYFEEQKKKAESEAQDAMKAMTDATGAAQNQAEPKSAQPMTPNAA